ncbi:V-type ATP synthase subunit D [Clostridium polynesiense]|uniref:V-type ATP synthase subunit D n=1 Tax=Clostridium polynesiense TaxID=1325933 RepID=UPI00058FE166|nr:V-type ATP synthase subunit D [Clostridium polynesiense]
MENTAPTKSNLMSAQSSLEFSQKGFELLDKKRNVLIREMMSYMSRVKELQSMINETFEEAYKALRYANVSVGINNVEDIALAIPESKDYEVIYRSVMGVEVPEVKYKKMPIKPAYGMYRSNSSVDEAFQKFNDVKYLIYELAEVENSVYKLAIEVKKTQKRANALQNIQIPKYKDMVKFISDVLDEKDREEFFRLKVVKKKSKK